MLETMRFAPMNLSVTKDATVHYTLPKSLESGETVSYTLVVGFKKISWKGTISAVNDKKIMVRLASGPFRGFTASHQFVSEGNMTACYDEFSFQGFSEFPEDIFSQIMANASVAYAVASRKAAREVIAALEAKKQTMSFEALDQSATAG